MTIPLGLLFGGRRLILSVTLVAIPRTPRDQAATRRRDPAIPAAVGATDAELVHLNALAAAEAERSRWEVLAVLHGLRLR